MLPFLPATKVTPSLAINEASFMVRVRDQGRLDYEELREVNFTLVAREVAGAMWKS